jgi:hypothetical protein
MGYWTVGHEVPRCDQCAEYGILGSNAVKLRESLMFLKNDSLLFSESKIKPRKKSAERGNEKIGEFL